MCIRPDCRACKPLSIRAALARWRRRRYRRDLDEAALVRWAQLLRENT